MGGSSNVSTSHAAVHTTRSASLVGLVVAGMFAVVNPVSKESTALNVRQPWQDDPYDVLVSLDFVVLPVLMVATAARFLLCGGNAEVPIRRLIDVLRMTGTALGICLVTEAAESISVVLGRHRTAWNTSTAIQIALLGLLTVLTIAAALWVRHAACRVSATGPAGRQPDALADLVSCVDLLAARTRSTRARRVVRWLDARPVRWIRRRPTCTAAVFAGVLASPFVGAKAVIERYPVTLLVIVAAFVWACLFVLLIGAGAYLDVVAGDRRSSPGLSAVLSGCFCGAVLFAFHDSLLHHQTIGGLATLLLLGGALGALGAFVWHAVRRHRS